MKKAIIDNDILTNMLTNDDFEATMSALYDIQISVVVYMEAIQAIMTRAQIQAIEDYLNRYPILFATMDVFTGAIALLKKYSASNGLRFADSLIAATCLVNELPVITFNTKHYLPIKGLLVIKPDLINGDV